MSEYEDDFEVSVREEKRLRDQSMALPVEPVAVDTSVSYGDDFDESVDALKIGSPPPHQTALREENSTAYGDDDFEELPVGDGMPEGLIPATALEASDDGNDLSAEPRAAGLDSGYSGGGFDEGGQYSIDFEQAGSVVLASPARTSPAVSAHYEEQPHNQMEMAGEQSAYSIEGGAQSFPSGRCSPDSPHPVPSPDAQEPDPYVQEAVHEHQSTVAYIGLAEGSLAYGDDFDEPEPTAGAEQQHMAVGGQSVAYGDDDFEALPEGGASIVEYSYAAVLEPADEPVALAAEAAQPTSYDLEYAADDFESSAAYAGDFEQPPALNEASQQPEYVPAEQAEAAEYGLEEPSVISYGDDFDEPLAQHEEALLPVALGEGVLANATNDEDEALHEESAKELPHIFPVLALGDYGRMASVMSNFEDDAGVLDYMEDFMDNSSKAPAFASQHAPEQVEAFVPFADAPATAVSNDVALSEEHAVALLEDHQLHVVMVEQEAVEDANPLMESPEPLPAIINVSEGITEESASTDPLIAVQQSIPDVQHVEDRNTEELISTILPSADIPHNEDEHVEPSEQPEQQQEVQPMVPQLPDEPHSEEEQPVEVIVAPEVDGNPSDIVPSDDRGHHDEPSIKHINSAIVVDQTHITATDLDLSVSLEPQPRPADEEGGVFVNLDTVAEAEHPSSDQPAATASECSVQNSPDHSCAVEVAAADAAPVEQELAPQEARSGLGYDEDFLNQSDIVIQQEVSNEHLHNELTVVPVGEAVIEPHALNTLSPEVPTAEKPDEDPQAEPPVEEEKKMVVRYDSQGRMHIEEAQEGEEDAVQEEKPQPQPVQVSAPAAAQPSKKFSIDMLERYVAPVQPKTVNNLRGAVRSNRPSSSSHSRSNSNSKPRPTSAAAIVQSSSMPRGDKTFLTGMNEAVQLPRKAHSQSAGALPKTRPTSPSPVPAHPAQIRYCNPIRFNVDNGWLTLSEICPHRKAFTNCKSIFCKEAFQKNDWLNMIRAKSKDTIDLVLTVDKMWRNKLQHALDQSIEELKAAQAKEMTQLKKKLLKKGINEKNLQETMKYFKRSGATEDKDNEEVYYATGGLTAEHYEFVRKQIAVHKDHTKLYTIALLDQRKAVHQKAIDDLKKAIKVPLKFLESMCDAQLQSIDFHLKRVERTIYYILDLTVSPSKTDFMKPPEEDAPTVSRLKRAAKQVTEFLRAALAAFASVCHEIRKVYCNADQEIQRMLNDGKMIKPIAPPVVAAPVDKPKRSTSASRKRKKKRRQRPVTAPVKDAQRAGRPKELVIDHFLPPSDEEYAFSEGRRSPSPPNVANYESDFEEAPRRISRMSTATSIPDLMEEHNASIVSNTEDEVVESEKGSEKGSEIYEEDFIKSTSMVLETIAELQLGLPPPDQQEQQMEGERRAKSAKAYRLTGKLPSGQALREELALAKLDDSKRNRKALLTDLLSRPATSAGEAARPRSAMPVSRLRANLLTRVEDGSKYSNDFEQEEEQPYNAIPCFHCNEFFRGRGRTMPSLTGNDDCWQRAQEDVSKCDSHQMPIAYKKVRIGEEIFDLSKTFLAKLQDSAGRVADGKPVFCSWKCVKKWALASCPAQHKYRTEMLINLAAGKSVR